MHRIEAYTRLAIIFIIIITIRKIRFILFNISYNICNNFVCTYEF